MKLTDIDTPGQLAFELVKSGWRKWEKDPQPHQVGIPYFGFYEKTCPCCNTRLSALSLTPNTATLSSDAHLFAVFDDDAVIKHWELFESYGGTVHLFDISELDTTPAAIAAAVTSFLEWEDN